MIETTNKRMVSCAIFLMVCLFASSVWAHGWTSKELSIMLFLMMGGPSILVLLGLLIVTIVLLRKYPTPSSKQKIYGIVAIIFSVIALLFYPGYVYFVACFAILDGKPSTWKYLRWDLLFSILPLVLGSFSIVMARRLIKRYQKLDTPLSE